MHLRREIIQDPDSIARVQELICEMGSNETGAARDQNLPMHPVCLLGKTLGIVGANVSTFVSPFFSKDKTLRFFRGLNCDRKLRLCVFMSHFGAKIGKCFDFPWRAGVIGAYSVGLGCKA